MKTLLVISQAARRRSHCVHCVFGFGLRFGPILITANVQSVGGAYDDPQVGPLRVMGIGVALEGSLGDAPESRC